MILRIASRIGNERMVRFLLWWGPDVNAKSILLNYTPLHYAAKHGHVEIARLLIEKGADVNALGCLDKTPLHYAALWGHFEIARLLIEKGADVSALTCSDNTLLHNAALYGYFEIARLLIENGADVNALGCLDKTPLHYAAEHGHVEIARLLIENGADVNAKNIDRWAPLHEAAERGHVEVAKLLIEKGANAIARIKEPYRGWTPLDLALRKHHHDMVGFLGGFIEVHGCLSGENLVITKVRTYDGEWFDISKLTPFLRSMLKSDIASGRLPFVHEEPMNRPARGTKIAESLIGPDSAAMQGNLQNRIAYVAEAHGYLSGDDVVISKVLTTDERWVPAAELTPKQMEQMESGLISGSVKFIDQEIARGPAADAAMTGSLSKLHSAAERGDLGAVAAYLSAGTNPDLRSGDKNFTAIALAARNGHCEVIRKLIAAGADPNLPNSLGGYPIHAAATKGHAEAVLCLIEGGARVNVKNGAGYTPLDLAAQMGHSLTMQVLKKHGGA